MSRRHRHSAADRRGCDRARRAGRGVRRRAPRRVPRRDRRAQRRAARVPPHGRRGRRDEHPDRAQGRHLDARDRDDRRLEDPRGLHTGLRRDRRRPLQGGRTDPPRQDEHGRVRHGLLHGELGLRPVAEPVGPQPRPRRLGRRHLRRRVRRPGAVGPRLGHRRLDQAAVCALRERRPASDVRDGVPLRRRRLRVEPRPDRTRRENGA